MSCSKDLIIPKITRNHGKGGLAVPARGITIVYMVSEAVLSPPSALPTRQTLSHLFT